MEFESVKGLVNSLDGKDYEKEIECLEKQIENISDGKPRYAGIYNNNQEKLTGEEAKREIVRLEKKIKDKQRLASRLNSVKENLESAIDKIDDLVKMDVLLYKLDFFMSRRREFEDIEKTSAFESSKSKYKKLLLKSRKKLEPIRKINKSIYKLLKKNQRLKVNRGEDIKTIIDLSKYNMKTLASSIYSELKRKYINNLGLLGVDTQRLNLALGKMKGEINANSLSWQGEECLDKLNKINLAIDKNYDLKENQSNLRDIRNKYIEIVELSREVWYIEELLAVFGNTSVKDTEMYQELNVLKNKQDKKLNDLIRKADNLYDNLKIEVKINETRKLKDLFKQTEELEIRFQEYQKANNYSQVNKIRERISHLRYEMIKILENSPELNKPEYNIDINKIIEENRLYSAEIEKPRLQDIETSEIITEPKNENIKITDSRMPGEKNNNGVTKKFELNDNLQLFRTIHYSNYMAEKVKKTELGKIAFSDYLKKVAPNLTELIEIEKERELEANTIYKQYMIYLTSLENKKEAMSFYEYAQKQYGVSNIDVPTCYEEEYKGMIK